MMEHTESLLVKQLKIGNEDAYRYIYDHHYVLLCHIANGYVKDKFLAETIVGDTIFTFGKFANHWRSQCLFVVTWRELFGIVVLIISHPNKRKKKLYFLPSCPKRLQITRLYGLILIHWGLCWNRN